MSSDPLSPKYVHSQVAYLGGLKHKRPLLSGLFCGGWVYITFHLEKRGLAESLVAEKQTLKRDKNSPPLGPKNQMRSRQLHPTIRCAAWPAGPAVYNATLTLHLPHLDLFVSLYLFGG